MMKFFQFQKSPEQVEKERRNQEIMSKQPEEQYRRPSPLKGIVFPNHNFINFIVHQDEKPITLHVYRYPPKIEFTDSEPLSIVVMFHGLNGHLGSYAHIAKQLAQDNQCVVVGFDHRGFGRSQGFPGLVESIHQHMADCEKFLDLVRQYYLNLYEKEFPIFLLGQSMGGMSCYNLALNGQPWVKGTILLAPAIKNNPDTQKIAKLMVNCIGGILPRMLLVGQSNGSSSKNPQITEDCDSDPNRYNGKVVPGTIKVLLNSMQSSYQSFNQFTTPFLVVMGGVDKMVDPDVATDLMRDSPSLDKTMIYKENMWHNIILEEEIEEILPQIIQWIKKRQ